MSRSAQATATDLSYVLSRGAQLRRHKFLRRYSSVVLASAIFAFVNAGLYWLLANRTNGFDAQSAWPVLLAMFVIPPIVSAGLVAIAQDRPPFAGVAFGTLLAYTFATAVLSALRLPLSYSSIVVCFLTGVIEATFIAVRLWTHRGERVRILSFDRAAWLREQMHGKAAITTDPTSDLDDVDIILIDVDTHHTAEWSRYLLRAYMRGVAVMPWTRYLERQSGRVDVRSFDVSDIAYSPAQLLYSRAKRSVDLLLVLVLSPIWLAVLGLVALTVLTQAGRPIVFKQARRGHGDANFTMLKLRTMKLDAGCEPAERRDDRVISSLGWLRHTRLDELPQLINVLRGEMSLVGPRPESVELAEAYEKVTPQYIDRRLVLPGLTGWAQVNGVGSRSAQEAENKLSYDLYYVKNLSFDLDMLILARTIKGLYRLARGVR